jgi:hypothetical protein
MPRGFIHRVCAHPRSTVALRRRWDYQLCWILLWALFQTGNLLFVTVLHGSGSRASLISLDPQGQLIPARAPQYGALGSGSWEIIPTQWPNALVNVMPSEPFNLSKVLCLRSFLLAQLNVSLCFTSQP